MTTPTTQPLDMRRLWLVSVISIVAIVAVNYVLAGIKTTAVLRSRYGSWLRRSSPSSLSSPSSSPAREPRP